MVQNSIQIEESQIIEPIASTFSETPAARGEPCLPAHSYLDPRASFRIKKIQIESMLLTEDNLGKYFPKVSETMLVYFQAWSDLFYLNDTLLAKVQHPELFLTHLLRKKKELLSKQELLQQLATDFIRIGDFPMAQVIGSLQNKFDELLTQLRELSHKVEKRIMDFEEYELNLEAGHGQIQIDDQPSTLLEWNPSNATLEEEKPVLPYQIVPRKRAINARSQLKSKERKKEKQTNVAIQALKINFKVLTFLFFFLMVPISFFASKNYGVEQLSTLNHEIYTSAVPLEKASGIRKTFYGQVPFSWELMDDEEKESSIQLLGAMLKPDGYQIVYIVDELNQLLASFNQRTKRVLLY